MTSIAVRVDDAGAKAVQGVATMRIALRPSVIATSTILAVGQSAAKLGLRHQATGGAGAPTVNGIANQRIALRPAGGLSSVVGVANQQLPIRMLLHATKHAPGISSAKVSLFPVEFGEKGVASTPRSSLAAAIYALGSGTLTAFGHARSVLSLVTFGTHAKAATADSKATIAAGVVATGAKASSADSAIAVHIRDFVVGTSIATTFGAARVSLSLASFFGAEKTIAGQALIELALLADAIAIKQMGADSLSSVALRDVVAGLSGAPARVFREIRGCVGVFDLDFGKSGSAENR